LFSKIDTTKHLVYVVKPSNPSLTQTVIKEAIQIGALISYSDAQSGSDVQSGSDAQ
jgi:hypothetical protein